MSDLAGLQARDAAHRAVVVTADVAMAIFEEGALAVLAARGVPPDLARVIFNRASDALLAEADLAAAPTLKGPGVEAHGIEVRR